MLQRTEPLGTSRHGSKNDSAPFSLPEEASIRSATREQAVPKLPAAFESSALRYDFVVALSFEPTGNFTGSFKRPSSIAFLKVSCFMLSLSAASFLEYP